jgi:hypothetical protein
MVLGREISCSQWLDPSMHSRCLAFNLLLWGAFHNFIFLSDEPIKYYNKNNNNKLIN